MGEVEVKLLGSWMSPFVRRVQWALKLKGVTYEYLEEDLKKKSPLLLNYNPIYKKIPVLVIDGKPIAESPVIIEFIDEMWKHNPILPIDPYKRSVARFWAKFIDEKLSNVVRMALFSEGEEQEKAVKESIESFEIVERELFKDKTLTGAGEGIGYLEILLGSFCIWLPAIEEGAGFKVFDSNKFPLVNKWMTDFLELSVIKEDLPPRDRLVSYFQQIRHFVLATKK